MARIFGIPISAINSAGRANAANRGNQLLCITKIVANRLISIYTYVSSVAFQAVVNVLKFFPTTLLSVFNIIVWKAG